MKKPGWYVPDYPALSNDLVGQAAVNGQLVKYPQIVRSNIDPPLIGQKNGLISFMLFNEPKMNENGKPVFGYFKIRGTQQTDEQSIMQSSRIIKEVDSKFKVLIAPVGHWLPISEDEFRVKEKITVKMEENETVLHGEAEKEAARKARKYKRELEERVQRLKDEEDEKEKSVGDDPDSLDRYVMRRVTEMSLTEAREVEIKKLEDICKNIEKTRTELAKLERAHPEYREQWLDTYNEARAKVKIPPLRPREGHFDEYEKWISEQEK